MNLPHMTLELPVIQARQAGLHYHLRKALANRRRQIRLEQVMVLRSPLLPFIRS